MTKIAGWESDTFTNKWGDQFHVGDTVAVYVGGQYNNGKIREIRPYNKDIPGVYDTIVDLLYSGSASPVSVFLDDVIPQEPSLPGLAPNDKYAAWESEPLGNKRFDGTEWSQQMLPLLEVGDRVEIEPKFLQHLRENWGGIPDPHPQGTIDKVEPDGTVLIAWDDPQHAVPGMASMAILRKVAAWETQPSDYARGQSTMSLFEIGDRITVEPAQWEHLKDRPDQPQPFGTITGVKEGSNIVYIDWDPPYDKRSFDMLPGMAGQQVLQKVAADQMSWPGKEEWTEVHDSLTCTDPNCSVCAWLKANPPTPIKKSGWSPEPKQWNAPHQMDLGNAILTNPDTGETFTVGDKAWYHRPEPGYPYGKSDPTTIVEIRQGSIAQSVVITVSGRPPTKLVSPKFIYKKPPNTIPWDHTSAWGTPEMVNRDGDRFHVGERVVCFEWHAPARGEILRFNNEHSPEERTALVRWDEAEVAGQGWTPTDPVDVGMNIDSLFPEDEQGMIFNPQHMGGWTEELKVGDRVQWNGERYRHPEDPHEQPMVGRIHRMLDTGEVHVKWDDGDQGYCWLKDLIPINDQGVLAGWTDKPDTQQPTLVQPQSVWWIMHDGSVLIEDLNTEYDHNNPPPRDDTMGYGYIDQNGQPKVMSYEYKGNYWDPGYADLGPQALQKVTDTINSTLGLKTASSDGYYVKAWMWETDPQAIEALIQETGMFPFTIELSGIVLYKGRAAGCAPGNPGIIFFDPVIYDAVRANRALLHEMGHQYHQHGGNEIRQNYMPGYAEQPNEQEAIAFQQQYADRQLIRPLTQANEEYREYFNRIVEKFPGGMIPADYAKVSSPIVNYQWIPLTQFELSGWDVLDKKDRQMWINRADRANKRARQFGVEGGVTGKEIWALVKRFEYNCAYCGKHLEFGTQSATLDHVRPLALQGRGSIDNLVPACSNCNKELNLWDQRNTPTKTYDYAVPHPEFGGPYIQKGQGREEYEPNPEGILT